MRISDWSSDVCSSDLQIVRYVNQIREGKFKTPSGRDILVNNTTPFYGYVVCDLTAKVRKWLELALQFTPMPDGLGWFRWFGNISLYMEVISWTKLLRAAEMRTKLFFHNLGIDRADERRVGAEVCAPL